MTMPWRFLIQPHTKYIIMETLPLEMLYGIIDFCDPQSFFRLRCTNRMFSEVATPMYILDLDDQCKKLADQCRTQPGWRFAIYALWGIGKLSYNADGSLQYAGMPLGMNDPLKIENTIYHMFGLLVQGETIILNEKQKKHLDYTLPPKLLLKMFVKWTMNVNYSRLTNALQWIGSLVAHHDSYDPHEAENHEFFRSILGCLILKISCEPYERLQELIGALFAEIDKEQQEDIMCAFHMKDLIPMIRYAREHDRIDVMYSIWRMILDDVKPHEDSSLSIILHRFGLLARELSIRKIRKCAGDIIFMFRCVTEFDRKLWGKHSY